MNNATFRAQKSPKNNQFYFHLRVNNGNIILQSEGYISKQGCNGGIESVKVNAPYDSRYEKKNKPGNYSFVLKAANGEVIGSSESYTTAEGRDNGIESVKKNAPGAPTEWLD